MGAASSMPAKPVVYRVIQRYCPQQLPGKEYTVSQEYLSAETHPSFEKYIEFTDDPPIVEDGIKAQKANLRLSKIGRAHV